MKNQLTLADLIPERKRISKSYYISKCPFHTGEVPALLSKEDEFSCIVCGAAGDAAEYLARRIHVTREDVLRDQGILKEAKVPKRIYEALQEAANYYVWRLSSEFGDKGRMYLSERKIIPKVQKTFQIGMSGPYGNSLHKKLSDGGFSEEELRETGLFIEDKNTGEPMDRFFNRVMFPITDETGRVIGFGGRILPGDKSPAKYVNSPESEVYKKRENLYAMDISKASKQGFLILCEGYMDVIAMHQAGFDNAVASLGTALTEEQCNLMHLYTDRVVVLYDSDEAGQNATFKALKLLKKGGFHTRVANYSGLGKDPDEVLKTAGRQAMIEVIRKSESGTSFLLRHMTAGEAVDLLLQS